MSTQFNKMRFITSRTNSLNVQNQPAYIIVRI